MKIKRYGLACLAAILVGLSVLLIGLQNSVYYTDTVHLYLVSKSGKNGVASFCAGNSICLPAPFPEQDQTFEATLSNLPKFLLNSEAQNSYLNPIFSNGVPVAYWVDVLESNQKDISYKLRLPDVPVGRYLIIQKDGLTYLTGRRHILLSREYYLSKVDYISFKDSVVAIAVSQDYRDVFFKTLDTDGVTSFKLKELAKYSASKYRNVILLSILLAAIAYWLFLSISRKDFFYFIKDNLVIVIPIFLLTLSIYAVIWPGIYGLDVVVSYAYTGGWTSWFSTMYMLLAHLLFPIGYGSFVLLNIFLFFFSLYNIFQASSAPLTIKKQVIILFVAILFFCFQGFVLTLFGVQRFFTTSWFFIAAWSSFYLSCFLGKDEKGHLFAISLVLSTMLILMRTEYFIMFPFFIWISGKHFLKNYSRIHFRISSLIGILVCILIIGSIKKIEKINNIQSGLENSAYVNGSLAVMAAPYIAKSKELPPEGFSKGAAATRDEVLLELRWFGLKVLEDPWPYLDGVLKRVRHAFFSADTWEHPYDKFIGFHEHRKLSTKLGENSSHEFFATNYFLNRLDYIPFSENLYSSFMNYIQFNTPWFKNGIVLSLVFMLLLFPILFLRNHFFLFANFLLVAKMIATALFAPIGFSAYYYDAVIWTFFGILLAIVTKKSPKNLR